LAPGLSGHNRALPRLKRRRRPPITVPNPTGSFQVTATARSTIQNELQPGGAAAPMIGSVQWRQRIQPMPVAHGQVVLHGAPLGPVRAACAANA
jgi:hypothetical protein